MVVADFKCGEGGAWLGRPGAPQGLAEGMLDAVRRRGACSPSSSKSIPRAKFDHGNYSGHFSEGEEVLQLIGKETICSPFISGGEAMCSSLSVMMTATTPWTTVIIHGTYELQWREAARSSLTRK